MSPVMAAGIDTPYPAGHSASFRRIGDTGLLVSELRRDRPRTYAVRGPQPTHRRIVGGNGGG
ncbi:hypothetical protein ACNQVK_03220 [Mycobacterium sp. 134]|uniref:hypothetical protein n=1 Tax=Mycobacterium sp. 134 TaxID=3400425 RepID=UPI003AAE3593